MNDIFSSNDEYIPVEISNIGYADHLGLEGFLILKSIEGKEFPINAFSGEVAKHILRFREGDKNTIPTIYNLVEEIAVMQDSIINGSQNIYEWIKYYVLTYILEEERIPLFYEITGHLMRLP